MKRTKKNYYALAILIIALVSLPVSIADALRSKTIAALSSSWNILANLKAGVSSDHLQEDFIATKDEALKRLELENQLLNNEIVQLKDLLEQELQLFFQAINEHQIVSECENIKQTLSRHQEQMLQLFNLRLAALPARVIYRSANSWNSSFWINVGDLDNDQLPTPIISKNSPVVIGDALVGVIDYVGKKQSLVRLITDSGLTPSVRVSRKGILLAKGEIKGQSLPLWRSRSQTLLGIGFNYDFADAEGPARDLRTGEVLDSKSLATPILLHQDLLITTGLDGVFPPGLKVGTVTKIKPLKEGDYYYELEAKPAAENLSELSLVFVLPSIGYDRNIKSRIFSCRN